MHRLAENRVRSNEKVNRFAAMDDDDDDLLVPVHRMLRCTILCDARSGLVAFVVDVEFWICFLWSFVISVAPRFFAFRGGVDDRWPRSRWIRFAQIDAVVSHV